MHRNEAIAKLKELEGQDLHLLAKQHSITVLSSEGKVNKGWAGHVCERHLGNRMTNDTNFTYRLVLRSFPLLNM